MKRCSFAIASLVLSATALSSYGAAIHVGLVNYWNFDGNNNDTAGSLSGNVSTVADNGTFAGANGTDGISYAAGFFGQGISLNGASGGAAGDENDGFVLVSRSADTLFGGKNLSMSVWFTVGTFDTGWQSMIAHGEGSQYRIARRAEESGIAYAGGIGEGPAGSAVNDGLWHNVITTTETGVGTTMYVDGLVYSTNVNAATLIVDDGTNFNLNIGANPGTGANNREWDGNIDDVAQWNRVLTQAEILQIYNSGRAGISLGQIPEPTTGMVAALSGWAFMLRRRRR